jgi:hypothetical protein
MDDVVMSLVVTSAGKSAVFVVVAMVQIDTTVSGMGFCKKSDDV